MSLLTKYACQSAFAVVAVALLSGCLATTTTTTKPERTSPLVGAVGGGLVGLATCKLLGREDCHKYALAGGVIGAAAVHLLNEHQQAVYEAAQAAGVEDIRVVERVDGAGQKQADIIIGGGEFFGPEGNFIPGGKEKMDKIIHEVKKGPPTKVLEVRMLYNRDSDIHRIRTIENSSDTMDRHYRDVLGDNVSFGTLPVSSAENDGAILFSQ